jgi:hypothetical protein
MNLPDLDIFIFLTSKFYPSVQFNGKLGLRFLGMGFAYILIINADGRMSLS